MHVALQHARLIEAPVARWLLGVSWRFPGIQRVDAPGLAPGEWVLEVTDEPTRGIRGGLIFHTGAGSIWFSGGVDCTAAELVAQMGVTSMRAALDRQLQRTRRGERLEEFVRMLPAYVITGLLALFYLAMRLFL